ncbi:MAG: hypothetical protein ACR2NL_08610 [Acidimicrobiia bacterium]
MEQALPAFVIFVVVAGGVIISLNRRTRAKMHETVLEGEQAVAPDQPKPRNLSKRQQRIVSTLEPMKEAPSIQELVDAEAADTGVNEIPGGEDLDVSLKLRVFWRDEVVRGGCEDGVLEFRVDEGVDPASAETEDVRLVCVRNGVDQPRPEELGEPETEASAEAADDPGDATAAPDLDVDGNFEAGLDVD